MKKFWWVCALVAFAILSAVWFGFHFGQYTCKLNYQATRVFV